MKTQSLLSILAVAAIAAFSVQQAQGHCQVPCGIYGDQLRFEAMLEDQSTIAKAGSELEKYVSEDITALSANQMGRWITTKEQHAQKIQDTIAEYFLAQRIKPDAENYHDQLVAAHNVIRAAMKVKQDPAAEHAEALKKAITDLYEAYEGKEYKEHSH
ncbi:MAG: superoxide dismutase, Ni [Verrucomicrobiales bacterium]|nr:superoxide dismutase, Ni [Verrucomicrobiales bacterium]